MRYFLGNETAVAPITDQKLYCSEAAVSVTLIHQDSG